MRSTTLTAILVPLLLFPHAGAGSAHVFLDANNDSGVWGGEEAFAGLGAPGFGSLTDCQSPAADILQLAVVSDEETLTLALSMVSLANLEMTCAIMILEGTGASYDVLLDVPVGAPLRAHARTTGFGIDGCVELAYEDARAIECLGESTISGDTITWTLPIAGVLAVELDSVDFGITSGSVVEERAYDFRGALVVPGGRADVSAENLLGLVTTVDFADGEPVTL